MTLKEYGGNQQKSRKTNQALSQYNGIQVEELLLSDHLISQLI